MTLKALVAAQKKVAAQPEWSLPDGIDQAISLTAALDVGGVTFAGLFLIGRANANKPDRNVSFTLAYQPGLSKRSRTLLARVDWRPPTPHTNVLRKGPPHLQLTTIHGTHHHSFELNWLESDARPRKWLPIAEPISPDYQGFAELLDGIGKLFRINNIGLISEPEWSQELF